MNSYTDLDEIRFKPIDQHHEFADEYHHVSFVISIGGEEASQYCPSDRQLYDKLTQMGRIEPHSGSCRTDMPSSVVLTGIDYDPICSEELGFAFSDAGEKPVRWPTLEGRMKRQELVGWLVDQYVSDDPIKQLEVTTTTTK